MNLKIIKPTDLKAASFEAGRLTLQVSLIVRLIKNSIANETPINKKDIIRTYLDWREKSGRDFYRQTYNGWGANPQYTYHKISREEYEKMEYTCASLSRQWFKNNLASAILCGKLVVLPVIDIDDAEMPNSEPNVEASVATEDDSINADGTQK